MKFLPEEKARGNEHMARCMRMKRDICSFQVENDISATIKSNKKKHQM